MTLLMPGKNSSSRGALKNKNYSSINKDNVKFVTKTERK